MRSKKSSSTVVAKATTKTRAKDAPKAAPSKTAIPNAKPSKAGGKAPSKSAIKVEPPKIDTILTVGCAGFPVPATRYFKEFLFVEVQETHVALPGTGTIRRWKREAPEGFSFSLLAPREIGQEGFRDGKVVESALKSLIEVSKELDARTAIFVAPPEFTNARGNKAAVKEFLQGVKKKFARVVWEPPPSWNVDEAAELAAEVGAIAARDPLMSGVSKDKIAYYRLPGPAGHKSRYEDPAIERLAELCASAPQEEATYVFTNVDMFADAKRFKKAMRIA
ncbi:MAG: DUF72 domain-containing protein [Polyangiaceae bacterium]